ncbi:MAG: hypothetical protein AB1797_01340 [bacterium]
MGTFYTGCTIRNHINRKKSVRIPKILVDTGSEYTWVLTEILNSIGVKREKKDLVFIMANGQMVTRSVGFAIINIEDHFKLPLLPSFPLPWLPK